MMKKRCLLCLIIALIFYRYNFGFIEKIAVHMANRSTLLVAQSLGSAIGTAAIGGFLASKKVNVASIQFSGEIDFASFRLDPRKCKKWQASNFESCFKKQLSQSYDYPEASLSTLDIDQQFLYEDEWSDQKGNFYFRNEGEICYLSVDAQECILNQVALYKYPSFRSYIKNLPIYKDKILALDDYYSSMSVFEKCDAWFSNEYCVKLEKRIHALAEQVRDENVMLALRQERLKVEKNKKILELEQKKEHLSSIYVAQLQDLESSVNQCFEPIQSDIYDNRLLAFEQTNKDLAFSEQGYDLSPKAKALADQYNVDQKLLSYCYGNKLQQVLHSEFVSIIERVAAIEKEACNSEVLIESIVDFVDIGLAYNHAGYIKKSSLVADFCWSLLDCTTAVVEGAVDGAINVGNMVLHPVDTMAGIAEGIGTVGYYLGKVLSEVAEMRYLMFVDDSAAADKFRVWCGNIDTVCSAIEQKCAELTVHEGIRGTTSFATETFLTGKVLSSAGKIFKYVKANKAKYLQYLKDATKVNTVALTAEGIPFRIADSAMEYMQSTVKQVGQTLPKFTKVIEHVLPPDFNLEHFRATFDSILKFKDKLVTFQFKHFLGLEIETIIKRSGLEKKIMKGLHHLPEYFEKKGLIKLKNKIVCPKTGVFKADVLFNGRLIKGKTFFPSSWSQEQVMGKIMEAFNNFKGIPELNQGRWVINSMTDEGVNIRMVFNDCSNMITAYPILKN